MEQSLGYLLEILSAHVDVDEMGNRIYSKIRNHDFSNEIQFARALTEEETNYLNQILEEAIEYAKQTQDFERVTQLHDVYETLFV